MAFVSFGFWALMGGSEGLRWPLVLMLCLVYMFSMRYFFIRLKIDISDFTKGKLSVVGDVGFKTTSPKYDAKEIPYLDF